MKYRIKILLLLIFISSAFVSAQNREYIDKCFNFPHKLDKWRYISQFTLALASLPEDYVEETSSLIYAPLFQYQGQIGYDKGFSAVGKISTNIITYNFQAGLRWVYPIKRVSFSIGYDVAFVWGKLTYFGFDSEIAAWVNYPGITVGIAFNNFMLSFQAEASIVTNRKQFTDNIEQSSDYNLFNGFTFSAIVEQPLWNDNFVSLGVRMNYLKLYYPVWAAFPTWDRFSLTPEFIMGFNF